jgi:hypothetical protein
MTMMMMTWAIAIAIFSIIPHDDTLRDSVDLVEVHHCFNDIGEHVWDQVIWWDWNSDLCDYVIVSHRCSTVMPDVGPTRDWKHGGYVSVFRERFQV